jgi:hypothetical protein
VSTIEELLERKSSGSGLENREYGRRDPSTQGMTYLGTVTIDNDSPNSDHLYIGTSKDDLFTSPS